LKRIISIGLVSLLVFSIIPLALSIDTDTWYGNAFYIDDTYKYTLHTHRISYRWTARNTKTLTNVSVYVYNIVDNNGDGVDGTNIDIKIYSDDGSGYPNMSDLMGKTGWVTVTSAGWKTFSLTEFNGLQVTAGQVYHVLIEGGEADDDPQFLVSKSLTHYIPYDNYFDPNLNSLYYNGYDWDIVNGDPIFVVGFTDGSIYGQPNVPQVANIFSGQSYAQNITLTETFCIDGLKVRASKVGSPTDDLHIYLFNLSDNSLVFQTSYSPSSFSTYPTFDWVLKGLSVMYLVPGNYKLLFNSSTSGDNKYAVSMQGTDESFESLTWKGTDEKAYCIEYSWEYHSDIPYLFRKDPEYIPPTTVTFYVVADTYIDSANPDTNYGTALSMVVQYDTSWDPDLIKYALMRFDISSIPDNMIIVEANLSLYCTGVGGTGSANVVIDRMLSTTWTETGVTWNNYGGYDTTNQSAAVTVDTADTWYTWNITDIVQYCYSHTNKQVDILARKTDSDDKEYNFEVKEDDPDYKAKLVITYQSAPKWRTTEIWTISLNALKYFTVEVWNIVINTFSWNTIDIWKVISPFSLFYYFRLICAFVGVLGILITPTLTVLGIKRKNGRLILAILPLYALTFLFIYLASLGGG